ncbi:MAG TPA: hypothetical protein VHD85_11640 [Terracidiphilus sp.]|nr:hypothetical protein [Terracidiphilus sp.]
MGITAGGGAAAEICGAGTGAGCGATRVTGAGGGAGNGKYAWPIGLGFAMECGAGCAAKKECGLTFDASPGFLREIK